MQLLTKKDIKKEQQGKVDKAVHEAQQALSFSLKARQIINKTKDAYDSAKEALQKDFDRFAKEIDTKKAEKQAELFELERTKDSINEHSQMLIDKAEKDIQDAERREAIVSKQEKESLQMRVRINKRTAQLDQKEAGLISREENIIRKEEKL